MLAILGLSTVHAQEKDLDQAKIREDLENMINDISLYYTYLDQKKVDLNCLSDIYGEQIRNIRTREELILFFEYLLDEFYDSHLHLNTHTNSSFRSFSPIYTVMANGKPIISNVWRTRIENISDDIVGAEILKFNGMAFDEVIDRFPTHCNDKTAADTKEWIANKILAGRYNEPRVITLRLKSKRTIDLDLDKLTLKNDSALLTTEKKDGIGVIRINNSLGNNKLISEFDEHLNGLMDTKGLIIDLRNTVDGGNSYVARAIMSRFISEPKPYQKHLMREKYEADITVNRSWVEYVEPRKEAYTKPVVILVGRWTGSMGEGLAIGFEGMGRAAIVGTEMERLAGEMHEFAFKNHDFGYRISFAQLYHVNGTPREKYIPTNYVKETTNNKDEIFESGLKMINSSKNN